MELVIHGEPDLHTQGVPWLLDALAGRRKIALHGEMGAGKTTLVKAICNYLGVRENTTSPTFSLVNQYSYADEKGALALFHHLDLYRLRSMQEALDIGIEELLYDPWYCFIEWPQQVEALLPVDAAKIQLEITGPSTRRLLVF